MREPDPDDGDGTYRGFGVRTGHSTVLRSSVVWEYTDVGILGFGSLLWWWLREWNEGVSIVKPVEVTVVVLLEGPTSCLDV